MKVLLIYPPMTLEERYSNDVGTVKDVGGHLPPLGLAYIASVLEKNNHRVKIIDATASNLNSYDIIRKLSEERPELIGISTLTSTFYRSIELAKKIKEQFPNLPIVLGGPHASIFPVKTLEENPFVDYAIFGEGEYTMLELVNWMKKGGYLFEIKGIAWRCQNIIIKNEDRELIENLDELPFPARHLLPIDKYKPLPNNYKRLPELNMLIGRGCPFSCSYCSKAVMGRTYRLRSVNNVIAEMKELIKNYKVKEIAFWDDVFTVDRTWVMDFCDRLIEEKLGIIWSCETRVNLVDKELLTKMKHAGCWNIFYGIESGTQELLDNINKGITIEQIRNAVKLTKEAGIEIRGSFMLALPGETPTLAKKTVDFAIELDVDYAQFCITTPFPGTKLYDDAKNYGTLITDFNKYTVWSPVFIPSGYKDKEEIEETVKKAYRRFYLRPSYFLKRLKRVDSFSELEKQIKGLRFLTGIWR